MIKPKDIFLPVTEDFKNVFGNDLISLILYGSGAGVDYVPGTSDINFLVVLSQEGMERLEKAIRIVKRWQKRRVAIPLFMTKEEILSATDAYPVEFLSMQSNYELVYGEDVLKDLSIDSENLRLQVERELRSKILHLRRGLLETAGRAKYIRELISISFTAYVSLFKALLHLKGVAIPMSRREVIRETAKAYSLNTEIFLTCADIREGIDCVPASEVLGLFKAYLKEVEKVSRIIDRGGF